MLLKFVFYYVVFGCAIPNFSKIYYREFEFCSVTLCFYNLSRQYILLKNSTPKLGLNFQIIHILVSFQIAI